MAAGDAPQPAAPPPADGKPTPRELLIWGLLTLFMVVLIGLTVWRRAPRQPPPPVLGEVPDFTLTDRDGRPFGRSDLSGTPWVADFIFTRCAGICPRVSARLERVLRSVPAGALHGVSISVDPQHDTPERLERYAARFDAPPYWHFLTGPQDDVYQLIRTGFKLPVEPSPAADQALPGEQILHSNRLVLVDGAGRVRGYYDSFDDQAVARLLDDLEALARGAP
ncbi:MAG: SCO family protein [Acidobacteria bacterium]|nr:MAG: SCO family protein [Acidobacteriota bacterium]